MVHAELEEVEAGRHPEVAFRVFDLHEVARLGRARVLVDLRQAVAVQTDEDDCVVRGVFAVVNFLPLVADADGRDVAPLRREGRAAELLGQCGEEGLALILLDRVVEDLLVLVEGVLRRHFYLLMGVGAECRRSGGAPLRESF